jgi:hypothetical protein
MKMCEEEPLLKMKSQVASCLSSFIRGLIAEDEENEDIDQAKSTELLEAYADQLVKVIDSCLGLGMQQDYPPL